MKNFAMLLALILVVSTSWTNNALAVPGKHHSKKPDKEKIIKLCRQKLAVKGFHSVKINYPQMMNSRSGNSFTGQFVRAKVRYEFNCVLNTRYEILDLIVHPLPRW